METGGFILYWEQYLVQQLKKVQPTKQGYIRLVGIMLHLQKVFYWFYLILQDSYQPSCVVAYKRPKCWARCGLFFCNIFHRKRVKNGMLCRLHEKPTKTYKIVRIPIVKINKLAERKLVFWDSGSRRQIPMY